MRRLALVAVIVGGLASSPVLAQTFNSGSTGADGALDLSTMNCSYTSWLGPTCYVQLPPSGILNYTTVNIPGGKTLSFKPNLQNSPVYLLAQGAVTIAGALDVGAGGLINPFYGGVTSRQPGPGGFPGGPAPAGPGFGPGAGPQADGSDNGKWVGPLSLVPLIGGSGGAAGACGAGAGGYGNGGGGAGAITIASSTTVALTGTIYSVGSASPECGRYFGAGCGSGGAIRIVANSIAVSGSMLAYSACSSIGQGVIRLEAPTGALSFTGSATPAAVLSTVNSQILPSSLSSLSIVSVGGYPVPTYAGQRYDTVDLLLPMQLPDPINVAVLANNIPLGTQIQIGFGTTNSGAVTPGTLSGSIQSSSATVQVSGLSRSQLAYLFVYATFAVPQSASAFNPYGSDHVAQVRVTTGLGAAPTFSFLRPDGSHIDSGRLPPEFLKQFRLSS
jgi:hypothetical protein